MKKIFYLFSIVFLFTQIKIWGQDNPFIGTWILETDPDITRVFTASTYTNYYKGISGGNPRRSGPTRYTYDTEKVYFIEPVQLRVGNSLINEESKWSSEYKFVDDKLILGGQIHIKQISREEIKETIFSTNDNIDKDTNVITANEENNQNQSVTNNITTDNSDIFQQRVFAGISYIYPLTFGINGGYLFMKRLGLYMGIDYTQGKFKNYNKGSWSYSSDNYDRNKISVNGIVYNNNFESTYSAISFVTGLNVLIISPLYASAGIGINIPGTVYHLYTRDSASNEYSPEWIEIDYKEDNSFIIETGIFLDLKYIYLTGKYRLIDRQSTFLIGLGFFIGL